MSCRAVRRDTGQISPSLGLSRCLRCNREEDHVHRSEMTSGRCAEDLTSSDTPSRTGDITFHVIT